MCDYTHLGVTQRCVVYTMCVIFTEYVVFAPIHCYAAFTLSVCSFTHFVLFCVFFSFLHKPSDFLHWLCLAQQIYAILSWNSFVVIYAFFGVNFLIQKFCPCKKKWQIWGMRRACARESKRWSWYIRSSVAAMCKEGWMGTLPSLRSLSSDWQDKPPTVPRKSWNTKHSVARCDWQVPLSMGFTRNWSQSWGWLPFSVFIAWTFWGFYQVM